MLYSLSEELETKILTEAKKVEESFKGELKLDEYVVLPDYGGKAILRFGIIHNYIDDISKLDDIECSIRDMIGDDYEGNLIGETYQIFGFNRVIMERGLKAIDNEVSNDIIKYKETSYGTYIKKDSEFLRELLKLSVTQKIWEIKALTGQDVDAMIIVVDTKEKTESDIEEITERVINIDNKSIRVIYFKDYGIFSGGIKAQIIAKLREKALHHIIMDYASHNYL